MNDNDMRGYARRPDRWEQEDDACLALELVRIDQARKRGPRGTTPPPGGGLGVTRSHFPPMADGE